MMRWLDVFILRFRSLLRRDRVESDLDRELAFHIDQLTEENIARGMSSAEARLAARRRLGGPAQIQEECRDMRRTNQIETIWNDFRYAVRSLRKTPAFTVVMVLTLGLAIGANSAIFSVIEGVLLRPLPYSNPDRLVRIHFNSDNFAKFPLNPNDFRDFRARNRTFTDIAAITRHDAQLSGKGSEPVMLRAFSVTSGYFGVLGFHPARGRDFTDDDELPGRGRVAILSDRIWRTRFSADPGIVGRTITLNAESYEVAGVMPPEVRHPGNNFHAIADGDTVDLWRPYVFDDDPEDRLSHFLDGIGRLKPGVSPAQGAADLSAVLRQLIAEHPNEKGWRVFLVPLQQEITGGAERMLLILLGAVGLLLLIACVNAANLLLARSSARVREIAVRTALGAGRGRIVRQLLTESLVIAGAAAALGTFLAAGGVGALVAFIPAGFPRAAEIRLDGNVFAFTLAVALLTGIAFGLFPALTASRTNPQLGLREGGRSTTSGTSQLRLRNFLVAGETGLASMLLIAAGLLLHSFINLLNADPQFRPERVVTASIFLPAERYRALPQRIQFFDQLIAGLESLPGVSSAAAASDLPWTGYDGNAGFSVEGRSPEFNSEATARFHYATPDYFRTLGIPLTGGRFFTGRDDFNAPPVLIINQAMAQRFWPGEDALQKRITFRSKPADKDWLPVIGIVADVKDQPDSAAARPAFWVPYAQSPDRAAFVSVRFNSEPATVSSQLRLAIHSIDPELAIADLRFMDQVADAAVAGRRFSLYLVALFAALALVLAALGLYGVISYSVNQRQHEFGLRMALGARAWDLLRMVLTHGLALSVAGGAAGFIAAALLTRFLRALLYGVNESDPLTFATVGLLVLAMAALACYVPARRAAGADPMQSLRAE